jgi:hypothetical protein
MGRPPAPSQEQDMHRDHQQEVGFKRGHGRREWERSDDESHQMEAREHARQPGKTRKTFGIRSAEAERQIRELRARY